MVVAETIVIAAANYLALAPDPPLFVPTPHAAGATEPIRLISHVTTREEAVNAYRAYR